MVYIPKPVDIKYAWYKYKKRRLRRCIHNFKSDLIDNMDHMRISGTEPRQWSLAKKSTCSLKKLKSEAPKSAETS